MKMVNNELTNSPTIFLHVGTAKTGTTAIQNFIGQNKILIEKQGVYYPKTGLIHNCHHGIAFYWLDNQAYKRNFDIKTNQLELLKEELKENKDKNILLSSECFLLPSVNWNHLIDTFPHRNIKIIIYFRRQDLLWESRYRELVKGNQITEKAEEWIDKNFAPNEYLSILKNLEKYVRKERIIIRIYEKEQFKNGSIYNDFTDALGICFSKDFFIDKTNFNPHLTRDALEFNRQLNFFFSYVDTPYIFSDILTKYSFQKIKSNEERIPILSQKTKLNILNNCEIVNSIIATDYLNRFDKVLFSDKPPDLDNETNLFLDRKYSSFNILKFIFKEDKNIFDKIDKKVRDYLSSNADLMTLKFKLLEEIDEIKINN